MKNAGMEDAMSTIINLDGLWFKLNTLTEH